MLKNYSIKCRILGNPTPKFFYRFPIYVRGAFGYTLKKVSCKIQHKTICQKCKLKFSCPFTLIFKPTREIFRGKTLMQKVKHVPRPYVFTKAEKVNEDMIEFNLRIYGNIIYLEGLILESLKGLEERSFLDGKVKLEIENIKIVNELKDLNTLLYVKEKSFLKKPLTEGIVLDDDIKNWVKNQTKTFTQKTQIKLEFQTPTKILRGKENLIKTKKVKLSDFIRYLARRRSMLNYFYAGKMFYEATAVKELMNWADKNTETIIQNIEKTPISIKRSKGFCMGRILFKFNCLDEDKLVQILDLLKFGEYMGVGEMTAFGMGQYKLQILNP